jgi:DNA-binding XRE family transcriptional regulator
MGSTWRKFLPGSPRLTNTDFKPTIFKGHQKGGKSMSRLRDVRRHRGFKAFEVAQLIGVAPSAYSVIENRLHVATPETQEKLAGLLDIPVSKLFQVDGLARK